MIWFIGKIIHERKKSVMSHTCSFVWKIWYKWDGWRLARYLSFPNSKSSLQKRNQICLVTVEINSFGKEHFLICKVVCCFQLYIYCLTMKYCLPILLFGTFAATSILAQDSINLSRNETENRKYDCWQGILDYKYKPLKPTKHRLKTQHIIIFFW